MKAETSKIGHMSEEKSPQYLTKVGPRNKFSWTGPISSRINYTAERNTRQNDRQHSVRAQKEPVHCHQRVWIKQVEKKNDIQVSSQKG